MSIIYKGLDILDKSLVSITIERAIITLRRQYGCFDN